MGLVGVQLTWALWCLIEQSFIRLWCGAEARAVDMLHHADLGMKKLISNCPALGTKPEFRGIMNLKGLDVIATRLWLDQSLPTKFPANVLAGFEPGVGGTYFNLSELQVSFALPALMLCAFSASA
jgi:hypothetical protein